MEKKDKRKIFELFAKEFETETFKAYFLDMCEEIPDYIFTMPSSTSGKYHNKTQCMKHGQMYHIWMFASIMSHRLRLKHNREVFATPEERDAMRCVPAFHDAIKCGLNGSQHTVQDHPLLAAKWVIDTKVEHDIPGNYKQMIADMCESHSGEWNKDRSGNVIMHEPRNAREFFVHECDILSSRADIDCIIPQELKDALGGVSTQEELPDINTFTMPFGKYAGKTLVEINDADRQYILWAKENIRREPVASLLEQL